MKGGFLTRNAHNCGGRWIVMKDIFSPGPRKTARISPTMAISDPDAEFRFFEDDFWGYQG